MVMMCVPCNTVTWKKLEGSPEHSVIITLPGETNRVFPRLTLKADRENTDFLFLLFCIWMKQIFKSTSILQFSPTLGLFHCQCLDSIHNPVPCILPKESEVAQSCQTLCDPMYSSLPGFPVHGNFQARVLEWVAISFSRDSSQPRDRTWVSHIVDRRFTLWATREGPAFFLSLWKKESQKFFPTFPPRPGKHQLLPTSMSWGKSEVKLFASFQFLNTQKISLICKKGSTKWVFS